MISSRSKETATKLELIFGLLLLPGVGWIYAGNYPRGFMQLIPSLFSIPIILGMLGFNILIGVVCCLGPAYIALLADVTALGKWFDNPVMEPWGKLIKRTVLLIFAGGIVIGLTYYMAYRVISHLLVK